MELLKLNELTKKKLDDTYIVVYAIKNEINIKKADIIEKNDIYTLIGVDTKGIRHLLNIYADKVNNSHFWLDVFEGLKSRGVNWYPDIIDKSLHTGGKQSKKIRPITEKTTKNIIVFRGFL